VTFRERVTKCPPPNPSLPPPPPVSEKPPKKPDLNRVNTYNVYFSKTENVSFFTLPCNVNN